ncbi:hypothetical protein MKW98_005866, partial [Papaver atlanticum]
SNKKWQMQRIFSHSCATMAMKSYIWLQTSGGSIQSLTFPRLKLQIHQVSDQLVDNNAQEARPAISGYILGSRLILLGRQSKKLSDVVTGSNVSLHLPHLHTVRLVHFRKFANLSL